MSSGDVIEIGEEGYKTVDHVQAGGILVDGLGIGDVGNIVLRDRQNLAQNGIIVVVLTLEKYSNQLLAGPDIVSRGFVYVRESEDLMDEAQAVVDAAVQDCLKRHVSDWGKIKNIIRDSLSDFLWKRDEEKPHDPSDYHGGIGVCRNCHAKDSRNTAESCDRTASRDSRADDCEEVRYEPYNEGNQPGDGNCDKCIAEADSAGPCAAS